VYEGYGFTGYYHDRTTGPDYAQQRYYASTTGRFLTPDPYDGSINPAVPGSWNKYTYVGSDPISFSDPSGLIKCGDLPVASEGGARLRDLVSGKDERALLTRVVFAEAGSVNTVLVGLSRFLGGIFGYGLAAYAAAALQTEQILVAQAPVNRWDIVHGYLRVADPSGMIIPMSDVPSLGFGHGSDLFTEIILKATGSYGSGWGYHAERRRQIQISRRNQQRTRHRRR
jgi:RHS repeat-associated protein